RLRALLRDQGQAERAFDAFVSGHPDLTEQRTALDSRRERLQRDIEQFQLEQQWFTEVAPALEAALLKLCSWSQRRFVANRVRGITTACGIGFDNPAFGPLSEDVVSRVFRFQEAYYRRGPEAGFERLLELAREKGIWPSRPAVTWR